MAKARKSSAFDADALDELLKGQDPATALSSEGGTGTLIT